jgi:dTDP-6-deoxy-L-talose 4-dehydrogenase (NAD+)
MKKVLVTGATGFIGNYVIEELLHHSYTVVATSLNEGKAREFDWFARVKYIPFDFSSFDNQENYFDFFDQPDAMIHLAWEGLPNYKSSFHTEINLPRHFLFLSNLLKNGLKDLTVTGTCLEYGMKEGCLSEDMAVTPSNPYAIAKDSLRKQLEDFKKEIAFSFKWVRLFYMYGKGQNPNSLFSQLDRAIEEGQTSFNMSGGDQVRDYLPTETVAAYIVRIAVQQYVAGIINCCSGQPIKLKDLVQQYVKEKKSNIQLNLGYYPYLDYEPMAFWGDNSKLQTILSNEKSN